MIEPVELFRVWPAVNQDRGKVTPQVDAGLPPENNEIVTLLKAQIDLLRSQLDDVRADREDIRADRNHWRQMAERGLLTDQRSSPERTPVAATEMVENVEQTPPPPLPSTSTGGFWSRLFGRQGDSPSEP